MEIPPPEPRRRRLLQLGALEAGLATLGAGRAVAAAAASPQAGRRIGADPTDYLAKLARLQPGDTLVLAPGRYGVDASGRDTGAPPGLPVLGLNGTAVAPITISGPESGPPAVLLGRGTHNTIRIAHASHVVIRGLLVDGRGRDGFGVGTQGPTHDITIEDNHFVGHDGDQQIVAISTTGHPAWNWIIRRNVIAGAGTGAYLGSSTGDSPFVAGLIEHNLFRDTVGYNLQVKHQRAWAPVPAGMPTGRALTVIRHNVFSKSANSSTGGLARPNLLVGDQPPAGAGASNGFDIHGNFFFQNPTESLFQGEGNIAFHSNLLVSDGDAVRIQVHNGRVRDVCIFGNTVVAGGVGIAVGGGAPGFSQQVIANAVFCDGAPVTANGAAAVASHNVTDARGRAGHYLHAPLAALGALDLYPLAGMLRGEAVDLAALPMADAGLDFNGRRRDPSLRGAYGGEGRNPGWAPALSIRPRVQA